MSAQLDELLAEQQKLQENLAAKVRHSRTDSRIGSRIDSRDLGLPVGGGESSHRAVTHTAVRQTQLPVTGRITAVPVAAGVTTRPSKIYRTERLLQRIGTGSTPPMAVGCCVVLCCVLQEAEKQRLLAERAAQQEVSLLCCLLCLFWGVLGVAEGTKKS
jgi:hypothetical protein